MRRLERETRVELREPGIAIGTDCTHALWGRGVGGWGGGGAERARERNCKENKSE